MPDEDEEARIARSDAICRTSAREWRAQAGCLRERAAEPGVAPAAAAAHLRSAESCDAQAEWWESGIVRGDTGST